MFLDMVDAATGKSAEISPCGKYRYTLRRALNGDRGTVNFIMLNPSTADALEDDPTIRRCMGFAGMWGYGELLVTNLFALRATNPDELLTADDPVGPENNGYLIDNACHDTVVAWGGHKAALERADYVFHMLRQQFHINPPMCLKLTKAGAPGHPLYLPKTSVRLPFVWPPTASANNKDGR